MSFEKNYILLEIKPVTKINEKDIENCIDGIKRHLNKFDIALVYPTHDDKCYIGLKTGRISELKSFIKKSPFETSLFVHIKLIENDNEDKLSNFAFYQLKEDVFKRFDFPDEPVVIKYYLKDTYGLDYLRVTELDVEETNKSSNTRAHYMLKLDDYQKKMMDFITSNDKNDKASKSKEKKSLNAQLAALNLTGSNPTEMTFGQIKVDIYQGNLIKQDVDVIVNAANVALILGGGIAGAIADACGPKVQKECHEYLRDNNIDCINVSDVMHTNAYKIPARYIIHAAGPRYDDYVDENQCFSDLIGTFFNVINYAANKLDGVTSIGIPLISSGIFGVPKDMCCEALYRAIEEFVRIYSTEPTPSQLKTIKLVNIDKETTNYILKYFSQKRQVHNEPKDEFESEEMDNTKDETRSKSSIEPMDKDVEESDKDKDPYEYFND